MTFLNCIISVSLFLEDTEDKVVKTCTEKCNSNLYKNKRILILQMNKLPRI